MCCLFSVSRKLLITGMPLFFQVSDFFSLQLAFNLDFLVSKSVDGMCSPSIFTHAIVVLVMALYLCLFLSQASI